MAQPVDLHGAGADSYVFVFQDVPGAAKRPRSDEIRVYDQRGTRLVERFRFEPGGTRAVYQYRSAADVDLDGAHELVGGYGLPSNARQALVPFAVDWDDEAERYRLVPLDLGRPRLSRPAANVPERQYRSVYAHPLTLQDPRTGLRISGHRLQDFAVTDETPRRLIAGYFLSPPLPPKDPVLELRSAILDATHGAPHATPCTLPGRPELLAPVAAGRSYMRVLLDRWSEASAGGPCAPVF